MTTQATLIASRALAARLPILRETALQIADPQVRAVGTIGGNVANGDPGNDMPAVMQALDASLSARGAGPASASVGRAISTRAPSSPRCEDGEILTAVRFRCRRPATAPPI